ncbi:hypothetical protein SOV_08260 [Sporomusa ovata DSM 2662]|uniref:Glycosyltransferase n=1 Tax=Sporomusa ovata TaxID=2378 RepID=A0A0U1L505_9FIRM|nr:glycosyltransferase [Sporomusa ovata]EQB28478.1 hypothetical protein SOV_1c01640 [Sporomusa ovata DSM 2662]CQR74801.1 hypothetical protein SpAn4DRAFT_4158 [Sporomusa ovata]
MKILFHTNQLSLRGTEVALFDYAHYNEEILHNESIIAVKRAGPHPHHPLVVEKFHQRFRVFYYDTLPQLQQLAEDEKVDIFYALKSGENDGLLLPGVKNCVHAVFMHYDPHGEVYAYISKWLSQTITGGIMPYVPHIVHLPNVAGDLRQELNIPESATVFGRYGGWETFDIPFVKDLVATVAAKNPDIYFLFMNTENFGGKLNNIIFLDGAANLDYKIKFIKTCDAMLHARCQGESFGLTCGEFSIFNKPVITCNADFIRERCHINILGSKGIYYANYEQLENILSNFTKEPQKNWDAYSQQYSPAAVMAKFKAVFIDG